MTTRDQNDDGAGCAIFLAILAIAALVAAAISLAALVDPFDWMPSVGEIWADCDDSAFGPDDECALTHRFPGFWWHAAANLGYAIVALALVSAFGATVTDLRHKRVARFASPAAAAAHREAHSACLGAGAALAAVALLPIVVAIA